MHARTAVYLTMVGRLIYEFGADTNSKWEVEVLAMLQENMGAALGSRQGTLGSNIVGSSLNQVTDQDACTLFNVMSVCAEDVPTPIPAMELIWCAGTSTSPPMGRVGLMKLRKSVFALLDRNLLLGETLIGVYMHDVSSLPRFHTVCSVAVWPALRFTVVVLRTSSHHFRAFGCLVQLVHTVLQLPPASDNGNLLQLRWCAITVASRSASHRCERTNGLLWTWC